MENGSTAAATRRIAGGRKRPALRRVRRPEGDRLVPDRLGGDVASFRQELQRRVIGQQPAVEAVTQAFQIFRSGLASPDRPLGCFLLRVCG